MMKLMLNTAYGAAKEMLFTSFASFIKVQKNGVSLGQSNAGDKACR